MPNNNPTGKGGLAERKGDINCSPLPREVRQNANKFKKHCFKLYFKNQKLFDEAVLSEAVLMVAFMKMLCAMCPQEIEVDANLTGVVKIMITAAESKLQ